MVASNSQKANLCIRRGCFQLNVVICDDNLRFAQDLRTKIGDYFAKIDKQCHCNVFSAPEKLLSADLAETHVLFLDVDMPQINGIDVARKLREKYPDIFIVFVTGWIEYAPAGYHVNAFRYLLKQRLDNELTGCLDAIREQLFQNQERILLHGRESPLEVTLNDIMYVEGSSYRMVRVHLTNGCVVDCRGKLVDYETEFCTKGFLRVQKSFVVNMRCILQIKGYYAHLKNGEVIKTTERGYSQVCAEFLLWKGQQL